MDPNRKIRLNLKIVIALIVVLLITVIGIIIAIVYMKNNANKQLANSSLVQNGNKSKTNQSKDNYTFEPSDFELSFLKMENNKNNLIYSPFSIKVALNMLKEGSDGETKNQIENVIGTSDVSSYQSIDKVLSFANAIYVRNYYSECIKKDYTDTLTNKYRAELKYDEFNNAQNVNNWISDKTFGTIKNILKDEDISDPDSVMLLINALAIDMEWQEKFDFKDTYGEDFFLDDGTRKKATMMHKKKVIDKNTKYYKDNRITALSMDLQEYGNNKMQFVAIMPKKNLSEYVNKISMEDINNILNKLTPAIKTNNGLNITVPKFSFDYDLNLKGDLMKIGITDVFDKKEANLNKMYIPNSKFKKLYVGDALHKANIDFSENGIKAAAVTVIRIMAATSAIVKEKPPIEINLNKPFLYLIRDKETNEIWFVGTLYQPNLWENDKEQYE